MVKVRDEVNNRITILETAGLTLPQHDKSTQDYTEFEVASMIVMTVLGSLVGRLRHGIMMKKRLKYLMKPGRLQRLILVVVFLMKWHVLDVLPITC
nr:ATP-binding protein [Leuconostoc citreum]